MPLDEGLFDLAAVGEEEHEFVKLVGDFGEVGAEAVGEEPRGLWGDGAAAGGAVAGDPVGELVVVEFGGLEPYAVFGGGEAADAVGDAGVEDEVFGPVNVVVALVGVDGAVAVEEYCGFHWCMILKISSRRSCPSGMLALPTPFDLRSYSRRSEMTRAHFMAL